MIEDFHTQRLSAGRFTVKKVKDDDDIQFVHAEGMVGEEFEKVMRILPHGLASHPPAGAHLLGVRLGHRSDTLALIGGEHHEKRIRNIGEGNTALYNADGSIMKMIKKDVTLEASTVTIKCGGVTMIISGDGVAITGGRVTHNGKNIGFDHKHLGVVAGSGISDVPV